MNHLDLFSGIGGFALAAQTVWGSDYHCVGFCEINPFCQQVLRKNFKGVRIYGDIRGLTAERLAADSECEGAGSDDRKASNEGRGTSEDWGTSLRQEHGAIGTGRLDTAVANVAVDLLTGGFPCQPFSTAGKRKGTEDDRFLWPEMRRVISEVRPTWIIGENVAGIVEMALGQVCSELEGLDYEVQCFVIPACAVNAPHRRDRVWIVAHSTSEGLPQSRRPGVGELPEEEGQGLDDRLEQPDCRPSPDTERNAEGGAHRGEGGERVGRRVDQDISERNEMGGNPSDDRSEPSPDADRAGSRASECGTDRDESAFGEERQQSQPQCGRQDCPSSGTSVLRQSGQGKSEQSCDPATGGDGEATEPLNGRELRFPDWSRDWREVAFESCVRGVDDGLPRRVAVLPNGERISESRWRQDALKAYGNAIVPQVAMEIMRAIKAVNHE